MRHIGARSCRRRVLGTTRAYAMGEQRWTKAAPNCFPSDSEPSEKRRGSSADLEGGGRGKTCFRLNSSLVGAEWSREPDMAARREAGNQERG